ncbi:hypothetical protein PV327_003682 [Microctonus hyperodae]|uniref:ATR-interacting protein mus304 n=1 Tax=Microctonus hyperodae TaxID=165561 RepID=A0AA39L1F7_MICHY|nr:hypothetical protein PV327_003682 [Microctonus hyperodae]
MSKRYGNIFGHSELKKPRLDISKTNESPKQKGKTVPIENDDLWGEDLSQDELEKLDIIASQACSQEVNVSTVNVNFPESSRASRVDNIFETPSTSTGTYTTSGTIPKINNDKNGQLRFAYNNSHDPSFKYPGFHSKPSQKLASSDNMRGIIEDINDINEFRGTLIAKGNLNSTFQIIGTNENVHESVEQKLRKLEKLESDYEKLLNELTAKEGETIFLRNQLQRAQVKAEKENIEKAKLMEEQAIKFRSEINSLYKEKESMKTQFQFQTLQMNNIKERCKILEKGSIKLTHPQAAYVPESQRIRSVSTPLRAETSTSRVRMSDRGNQTEKTNYELFELKSRIIHYPFRKIPKPIFEWSLPEKCIVDIENLEKRGRRIVPILEDEETFQIFENSELVKPKVTIVDNKILNVEFFQHDIASIINKTESEINSHEVIVIINKIVATLRELLLNVMSVLRTISSLLNNDDIRNMNKLYLSNFYDMPIHHEQTLCDAKEWHDKERGVEARRTLGILCYIAKESDYLCEYIAGKCELNIKNDESYKRYSKQIIRYSEWSTAKQHKYELLELILQLVTILNYVRRSHQFTGIICGITEILKIVQNRVGFDSKGLNYITKIYKELLFARPLPRCLISMTEMIVAFSQAKVVTDVIMLEPQKSPYSKIKNVVTFREDICLVDLYDEQLKSFRLDEISTIHLAHALLTFADVGFRSEVIPWPFQRNNKYDSSTTLMIRVLTLLYKSAKININSVKEKFNVEQSNEKKSRHFENNFWLRMRNKQFHLFKMGIRFLSFLIKRDPETIIRSVELETAFPLFWNYLPLVKGLKLNENEEAEYAITQTKYLLDKPAVPVDEMKDNFDYFDVMWGLDENFAPTPTSGKWFNFDSNLNEYHSMAELFKSKLQI